MTNLQINFKNPWAKVIPQSQFEAVTILCFSWFLWKSMGEGQREWNHKTMYYGTMASPN